MPAMTDRVVDLSHHNTLTSNAFHQLADGGIVGVIHKATQGQTLVDSSYADRQKRAQSVGLLWGAYHFLVREVPVAKQLDHFLSVIDPDTTLIALDFETNQLTGTTPSIDQAREFVQGLVAETGRFPVFYSGHTIKEALGNTVDPLLKNCPLWWAQYGSQADVQKSWSTYTLWQFTESGSAPGVVGDVDRSRFQGSSEQLAQWWRTQLLAPTSHLVTADGNHQSAS